MHNDLALFTACKVIKCSGKFESKRSWHFTLALLRYVAKLSDTSSQIKDLTLTPRADTATVIPQSADQDKKSPTRSGASYYCYRIIMLVYSCDWQNQHRPILLA